MIVTQTVFYWCHCSQQLYCSVATMIACNVAGIMTHHPRELAQRRAFLETRDCVEARLVTQRENQQQVTLHHLYFRSTNTSWT